MNSRRTRAFPKNPPTDYVVAAEGAPHVPQLPFIQQSQIHKSAVSDLLGRLVSHADPVSARVVWYYERMNALMQSYFGAGLATTPP